MDCDPFRRAAGEHWYPGHTRFLRLPTRRTLPILRLSHPEISFPNGFLHQRAFSSEIQTSDNVSDWIPLLRSTAAKYCSKAGTFKSRQFLKALSSTVITEALRLSCRPQIPTNGHPLLIESQMDLLKALSITERVRNNAKERSRLTGMRRMSSKSVCLEQFTPP